VQEPSQQSGVCRKPSGKSARRLRRRAQWFLAIPLVIAVAGCGGGISSSSGSGSGGLKVAPGTATIDTNCTGCTGVSGKASSYLQFTATQNGSPATVTWKVSGGDASTGAGTISSTGQYTPSMGYLTADSVTVTVTATLASNNTTASATITVTPGFLQPLSPENLALGGAGTATIMGVIAEAGGTTDIKFSLASAANGSSGGQGALVAAPCTRSSNTFTTCTVVYTAPPTVSGTSATYIVGTVGTSNSKDSTEVLLNSAGVNSNPATHEAKLSTPIPLGSSGGNNKDYDSSGNQITDCCGGTLGALIQNGSGTQYILSNNHVLARSDQASQGEDITQPGLVDENCDPSKGTLVGTLTGWLQISSSSTNADAAIAQINSGAVDTSGAILELGPRQLDGTLAAKPPGTSSTAGKGENPSVGMTVAKSGRTTGLTCASVSATSLSVQVDYFKDCGETQPYFTKTYQNQMEITGSQFSDAGDSGSLVVNTSNGEPVGLFFAGGVDTNGQSQSVASPAPDVLNELGSQLGGTYTFVGTGDHGVSCLNYGAGTVAAAQARTLTGPQIAQAQTALGAARQLVNPSLGILGVTTGKSSDEPGTPAVVVYVKPNTTASVPATIGGLRTVVVPTSASAVATGSAPLANLEAATVPSLPAAALSHAAAIKESLAAGLMKQNPAFFGVGVGQSYDDPTQPALVVFVDRNDVPATLPATIGGLRTRYVIMSRLHVTRAYASPIPTRSRCSLQSARPATPADFGLQNLSTPRPLPLN
jgi:hypothetical protein